MTQKALLHPHSQSVGMKGKTHAALRGTGTGLLNVWSRFHLIFVLSTDCCAICKDQIIGFHAPAMASHKVQMQGRLLHCCF